MAGRFRSWWHRWLPLLADEQRRRPSPWCKRPMLEVLEDRCLLSAYVVSNTNDSGAGSLRDAITQVNAGKYNEIDFAIGASGSAQTITPLSALPAITASGVYLDGLSQNGGSLPPMITLNGASAGSGSIDGLLVQGSKCTESGLIIEDFSGSGIEISGSGNTIGAIATGSTVLSGNGQDGVRIDAGASGTLVEGSFIGTDYTGSAASPNHTGILVQAANVTIGGTGAGAGNVVSGNGASGYAGDGILIENSGITVQGNYIGTNAAGNGALGNWTNGIELQAPSANNITIGGTTAGAGNVISANGLRGNGSGIFVGGSGVQIQGNYIGTDATGQKALGNAYGIMESVSKNTIGGTTAAARNIISGNGSGIDINSTLVVVEGNYIGTNASGTSAVDNGDGIRVFGNRNTIGGTAAGARNIISGNTEVGLLVGFDGQQISASGTIVQGNLIGTDITGTSALPNSNGIEVAGSDNTIGSTLWSARNVISGNTNDGILFDLNYPGGESNNLVLGNIIGANLNNNAALHNNNGIEVQGHNDIIGGTTAGARNIISGNSNDGLLFDVWSSSREGSAAKNLVQGNFIGLNSAGNTMGNGNNGIEDDSGGNTIGGTVSAARNYISANSVDGILIGSTASPTLVEGDFIGTNLAGNSPLPNRNGVEVAGTNNTIGSSVWAARSVISGNTNDGVLMDSAATRNVVLGNIVGANFNNTAALANKNGIETSGAYDVIGGTVWSADHNVLSGNSSDGVLIDNSAGRETVQNNLIGLSTAFHAVGNGGYGVSMAGSYIHEAGNYIANNAAGGVLVSQGSANTVQDDGIYANGASGFGPGIVMNSGVNNSVAAPVLNSSTLSGTTLTVTGTFNAPTASGTYLVYFYANPSNDPEGRIYLGRLLVSPSATGTQSFTFTTTTAVTGTDPLITATLTDNLDDTSAFSTGLATS